jgi:hypothetical protein
MLSQGKGRELVIIYFGVILCFSVFTNYNFSQQSIFLFFVCNIVLRVSTLYGHLQVTFLCTVDLIMKSAFATLTSVYM